MNKLNNFDVLCLNDASHSSMHCLNLSLNFQKSAKEQTSCSPEVDITLLELHHLLLHTDTGVATKPTSTHFLISVTDSGFELGFKFGLGLLTFLILQRLP